MRSFGVRHFVGDVARCGARRRVALLGAAGAAAGGARHGAAAVRPEGLAPVGRDRRS